MIKSRRLVCDNGTVYELNGDWHRPNGPAVVYDANVFSELTETSWYLYDLMHRYYGPQDDDSEWWIHGKWIK
jgi:hypothetical protein